jgi:hypothetical protein
VGEHDDPLVRDKVNLIMDATEVARLIIPCIFESNQAKILQVLYTLSAYRSDVYYRKLGEYTRIGFGSGLEYPLKALEDLALVYRYKSSNLNIIGLTDMGKIAAESVINTLELLLNNIEEKSVRPDIVPILPKLKKAKKAIQEVKEEIAKEKAQQKNERVKQEESK